MTLRTRLTAAFLAVVLGPVVLGALFVGGTTAAVNRSRALDRLDLATTALRGAIDALCQGLAAAARTAAVASAAGQDDRGAQRVVDEGLADALYLSNATGTALIVTPDGPSRPWADCAATAAATRAVGAIAAVVAMRDASGQIIGYASAAARVDDRLLGRLAAAAGASVTLLDQGSPLSTERADRAAKIASTAAGLAGSAVGHTVDGRSVRRLAISPGQPLPLAVSVAYPGQNGLRLLLVLIVLLAGLVTVAVAWWLARSTTRPLAQLANAAARVAAGDLSARVPVRTRDEVGRLAVTFNRMTREMQAYVEALTASRDQLRGNLGLLGDTLSSTHDLQRMLQVILRTALAATSAQAGVVLLVDPADGVLVGQCGQGLAERGAGEWPLRLPLGVGLLGAVAQTGECRRGRDLPPLAPGEPSGQTYIAVPFATRRPPAADRAEHAVRGVLALYDRLGNDEFDDADQVTLRTFAEQAAVAVENVRIHEEAKRLSYTDPLTGLYNYRMLRDSLRREVERANRFGHRLCVLVLDLDRFKEVNDSYGHAAGDAVLAEFARRLRAEVREVDVAFRQGGEEFVLLLPETDALGGITLAERLGTATRGTAMTVTARRIPEEYRRQSPVGRQPDGPARTLRIPVTVSIGIAVFPDHGATGVAVLDAADDALYVAKADGRDTYRVAGAAALVPTSPAVPAPAPATPVPPVAPLSGGGVPPLDGGPHAPRQTRGR
ncbi:MAG: two-component system, cell cycle response regulator [Micromonosporaceae bacterium]